MDIHDPKRLFAIERKLTMLRILELLDTPIVGSFDLEHLQSIHRYIFQDIYQWAGEIRKVDIAKGNMFCNVKFIGSQAEEIYQCLTPIPGGKWPQSKGIYPLSGIL